MNQNEFCYWLQGFFELSGSSELNATQVRIIKDHLDLVFIKETPVRAILEKADLTHIDDLSATSDQQFPIGKPFSLPDKYCSLPEFKAC